MRDSLVLKFQKGLLIRWSISRWVHHFKTTKEHFCISHPRSRMTRYDSSGFRWYNPVLVSRCHPADSENLLKRNSSLSGLLTSRLARSLSLSNTKIAIYPSRINRGRYSYRSLSLYHLWGFIIGSLIRKTALILPFYV